MATAMIVCTGPMLCCPTRRWSFDDLSARAFRPANLITVFPVATVARPVPNKSECQIQPEYGERGTGKVCLLPTGQMYHLSLSHRLLPSSGDLSLAN